MSQKGGRSKWFGVVGSDVDLFLPVDCHQFTAQKVE